MSFFYALEEQPKKRKRIRCISADSSDSDVIPVQKKKAKPIATDSQNTEGNGFDSQETRLDTDNEDERIEFLGEAFPSASKKVSHCVRMYEFQNPSFMGTW